MEQELILQSIGITGIIIFYIVLAKLSARMGEGLMLRPYYLLDYAACVIVLSTIPVHLYIYQQYGLAHLGESLDLQVIYFSLLLLSNIIVILVSIRYWWWLKSELWPYKGGK